MDATLLFIAFYAVVCAAAIISLVIDAGHLALSMDQAEHQEPLVPGALTAALFFVCAITGPLLVVQFLLDGALENGMALFVR